MMNAIEINVKNKKTATNQIIESKGSGQKQPEIERMGL